MANEVDPRLGQIPEALQKDPIIRRYFEDLERFWHDMWVKVGAGTDPISLLENDNNRKSDTLLIALLDKVSLGDPVTIDTTGFTIDTTEQFTDTTES